MNFDKNDMLLCFYGDDFTGSTDAMEALTLNGLRTILFLQVPFPKILEEQFPDAKCFGVAGISRTMSPVDMEQELAPVLTKLKQYQTPIVHYKTCSTFDSSPQVGSIGKVVDVGKRVFNSQAAIPLLVGVPELRRYTVFGNHFATMEGETFRLDRHPTMRKHPVTPMDEADLRLHLRKQTSQKMGHISVLDLNQEVVCVRERFIENVRDGAGVILFDVLDDGHMEKIGELLCTQASDQPQFVIGSSGIEYALARYWKKSGYIGTNEVSLQTPGRVDQLLVVSGSCSPVTEGQIKWALDHGFIGMKVPSVALLNESTQVTTRENIVRDAEAILKQGNHLILYSAFGPDDEAIKETKQFLDKSEGGASEAGNLLGKQLAVLTKKLLQRVGLKRVVVAGGDTSGYTTRALDIYALEMLFPLAPGSPLCRCYSNDDRYDGLEIALKGGQVGHPDYFGKVLAGE